MNLNTNSNKKAEITILRLFVYLLLENTHNTACNCPCPWLHPTIGNTSGRRTIEKTGQRIDAFPSSGSGIGVHHRINSFLR